MAARRSKALLEALAIVAPGQPLREGLARVVKASMGALIVVGKFDLVPAVAISGVVAAVSGMILGMPWGAGSRPVARGVAMPDPADEHQVRAVFRDFALDPTMPVALVCEFYNLPKPDNASAALGDWMGGQLHRAPVAGDAVQLGTAMLVVRAVAGGKISQIGLGLKG